MPRLPIRELKGKHKGQDIWIIAAGPSAQLIEPEFFKHKITMGVNRIWLRFTTNYLVIKEGNILQMAIDTGSKVIASRYHTGCRRYMESQAEGRWYSFDHNDNGLEQVDLSVIGTDRLVVSYSTITSAMHAAAYMGAANIILVGHDCGKLDGKVNIEGYIEPPAFYNDFLASIEPQSQAVRDRLKEVYGCNIYSLNPFLNFGLEGHKYERL